jgi:hypothetical protein
MMSCGHLSNFNKDVNLHKKPADKIDIEEIKKQPNIGCFLY